VAGSKGFSLIEITVALIIVGIAAAITIPNIISSMEQTKAQMARNNLYAISAAQEKYFEDQNPNSYCTTTCGNTSALDASLQLSISDTFQYSCSASGSYYSCTAQDGTDTLTIGVTAVGITSYSCNGPNNNYCPT
jgi:type IV pilus assembly protein PilA